MSPELLSNMSLGLLPYGTYSTFTINMLFSHRSDKKRVKYGHSQIMNQNTQEKLNVECADSPSE